MSDKLNPVEETKIPRKRVRRRNTFVTQPKIGLKNIGNMTEADFVRNYYARRRLLTVPDEIAQANPDKHFVYLDMNALQKSGFHHPGGYELYKASNDPENQHNVKFNKSPDGYIHRNEMVLAYISKEEAEMRKIEYDIVRGRRRLEDIFENNEDLRASHVYAKSTTQTMDFKSKVDAKAH